MEGLFIIYLLIAQIAAITAPKLQVQQVYKWMWMSFYVNKI